MPIGCSAGRPFDRLADDADEVAARVSVYPVTEMRASSRPKVEPSGIHNDTPSLEARFLPIPGSRYPGRVVDKTPRGDRKNRCRDLGRTLLGGGGGSGG